MGFDDLGQLHGERIRQILDEQHQISQPLGIARVSLDHGPQLLQRIAQQPVDVLRIDPQGHRGLDQPFGIGGANPFFQRGFQKGEKQIRVPQFAQHIGYQEAG